jgi:bifunctional non-homologous end joining protein LigD
MRLCLSQCLCIERPASWHFPFDLIELDGRDLRRETIETRKAALLKLLRKSDYGIFLNEQVEDDAAIVFQHACKLGLEGIVSKGRGSPYLSGRSPHWLKLKNPNSAAVRREAEEEWGWASNPAIGVLSGAVQSHFWTNWFFLLSSRAIQMTHE